MHDSMHDHLVPAEERDHFARLVVRAVDQRNADPGAGREGAAHAHAFHRGFDDAPGSAQTGRDRQRAPFLLLGFILAIPVGIMFGWFKAILVCVGSIALLISALYLTTVHRSQYLQKIASLEEQMKEAERKRF